MSCRHDLANGNCVRCYPATGKIDPGPEEDYGPNLEGPGAAPAAIPHIEPASVMRLSTDTKQVNNRPDDASLCGAMFTWRPCCDEQRRQFTEACDMPAGHPFAHGAKHGHAPAAAPRDASPKESPMSNRVDRACPHYCVKCIPRKCWRMDRPPEQYCRVCGGEFVAAAPPISSAPYWTERPGGWALRMPCGHDGASVWMNGVWHTWDRNGVGGENAEAPTTAQAKNEALAAVLRQGWHGNECSATAAPRDAEAATGVPGIMSMADLVASETPTRENCPAGPATCQHGAGMTDYCEPCGRINGGG